MKQVGATHEVPQWKQEADPLIECEQTQLSQVLCWCSIHSAPRLQVSHWNDNDDGKWPDPKHVTQTETQHKKQHGSWTCSCRWWTEFFLEAQGCGINCNILYQDNKSTIVLNENGKKSSSKRTSPSQHLLFLLDQPSCRRKHPDQNIVQLDEMMANFMSKPLQG